MSAQASPATVDDCLRVGTGFSQGDRNWIVEQFATLDARLATFAADRTELEVSVKDRAARGQKVTLECWVAGRQKIVTTSAEEDLHTALNDVRDDLRRRLNDAKTRQEPRHNRHLRETPAPETTGLADDLLVRDADDLLVRDAEGLLVRDESTVDPGPVPLDART